MVVAEARLTVDKEVRGNGKKERRFGKMKGGVGRRWEVWEGGERCRKEEVVVGRRREVLGGRERCGKQEEDVERRREM